MIIVLFCSSLIKDYPQHNEKKKSNNRSSVRVQQIHKQYVRVSSA